MLKGLNFDRSLVTPEDDATIYSLLGNNRSQVLKGLTIDAAHTNTSAVALTAGLAVIQGYIIKATTDGTTPAVSVSVAGLQNVERYLCATVDLNKANVPTGTVGTTSYAVDYQQIRFEFLDLATVKAQLDDTVNLHDLANPARIVSMPLYKLTFGATSDITATEQIYSRYPTGTVAGNPDVGVAMLMSNIEHFLAKNAADVRIPLSGARQSNNGMVPFDSLLNRRFLGPDLRSGFTDCLNVQQDGVYQVHVSGTLKNGNFDMPAAGNKYRIGGKAYDIVLKLVNDQSDEFGNRHIPPTANLRNVSIVSEYTNGLIAQAFSGTVTVPMYKGDNMSLHFLTTAGNAGAINATAITTAGATSIMNYRTQIERVSDLDGYAFGTGGVS